MPNGSPGAPLLLQRYNSPLSPSPHQPKLTFRTEEERKLYELDGSIFDLKKEEIKSTIACSELGFQLALLEGKEMGLDRELARIRTKIFLLT